MALEFRPSQAAKMDELQITITESLRIGVKGGPILEMDKLKPRSILC